MNLLDLPELCLVEILRNVPAGDLIARVGVTCHVLRDLSFLVCSQLKSLHIMMDNSALDRLCSSEEPSFFGLNFEPDLIVCVKMLVENHMPDINLYNEEHVDKFRQIFPSITSLTVSGSISEITPKPMLSLIGSYEALIRLQCLGKFDLFVPLTKLKHLKHFTHISVHVRDSELDRQYMEKVPELFHQLETLKLNSWTDPNYLPPQLKEVRFQKYPEDLCCNPQHFHKIAAIKVSVDLPDTFSSLLAHKIAAIKENVDVPDTFSPLLARISNYTNIQHIHISFDILLRTEEFFTQLFEVITHLPKLTAIVLTDVRQYYSEGFLEDYLSRRIDNKPAGSGGNSVFRRILREKEFKTVKHLRITGIQLPFSERLLAMLFPNASIVYKVKKNAFKGI